MKNLKECFKNFNAGKLCASRFSLKIKLFQDLLPLYVPLHCQILVALGERSGYGSSLLE